MKNKYWKLTGAIIGGMGVSIIEINHSFTLAIGVVLVVVGFNYMIGD